MSEKGENIDKMLGPLISKFVAWTKFKKQVGFNHTCLKLQFGALSKAGSI